MSFFLVAVFGSAWRGKRTKIVAVRVCVCVCFPTYFVHLSAVPDSRFISLMFSLLRDYISYCTMPFCVTGAGPPSFFRPTNGVVIIQMNYSSSLLGFFLLVFAGVLGNSLTHTSRTLRTFDNYVLSFERAFQLACVEM